MQWQGVPIWVESNNRKGLYIPKECTYKLFTPREEPDWWRDGRFRYYYETYVVDRYL